MFLDKPSGRAERKGLMENTEKKISKYQRKQLEKGE